MVLAHNIIDGSRTQDVKISEDVTFGTMLLSPNTLEGLINCNFIKPSPIQLHGIPLGKCGFDLLLEAKSGTGKTAVFTVITLEKLDLDNGLQTIILAPTREIAAQICDVIKQIGSSYKNFNVEVVIGGLPLPEDIAKFKKKVHVVVGSPGRLKHLIQGNHIDVTAVRLLVLDEADKLMDKSFQVDINYIFSVLPKNKQVIMSSATYPETLKSVMNKYVHNAQHICPDSTSILIGIKQLVVVVKDNSNIVRQTQNRFEELLNILSKKNFKQCLIFCNYQVRVRDLFRMLMRAKWPAEQLHGQQEQSDRLDALKTLQEYKCRILVSTDLAARGIDASNIDLVINFEPPYDWQTYLHRIGRAGRFGSYGIAISILSEGKEELKFINMIKSINSSLELKDLWDDEKLYLDNCQNSLNIAIDNNNSVNDLLNKLMHGDLKYAEETNSIESLCNNNITKENEFETFNDLLNCFDTHTIDANSSCKNLNTEPENECISNMQKAPPLLKINKELEENLLKIRGTVKITDDSQNHKENKDAIGKSDRNSEKHLKKINITENNLIGYIPKDIKHEIKDDKNMGDLESDEYYMNKSLLDAGLPTSFTSSKFYVRRHKNVKKTSTNDMPNISNITKKQTRNRNKSLSIVRSKSLKPDKEKYLTTGADTNLSNVEINSKYPESSNVHNLRTNIKNNNCNRYYSKIDSLANHDEIDVTSDIHTNYVIWYNQLKTRIEQIQMYLYIEELSTM